MDYDELFDSLTDFVSVKKEKVETCCDNTVNYIQGDGIILCKICQNTISNISDTPEWRTYSKDSGVINQGRCGLPVNNLLPKSSLGSSVSFKNRDAVTNKIGMYQKWNSMPYKERSLYKVFNGIDAKCMANGIPSIISSTAKSLYRVIAETKISRGDNRKGIIAACVYNACKECGVPRSIKELSEIFDLDAKIMTKGCKNYTEIMRMSKTDINRIQNVKSVEITDFIERFCHKLSLSERDTIIILQIATLCDEFHLLNDNTPPSMAAGCIYLYTLKMDIPITKQQISDICLISEVTINKCYKKINDNEIVVDLLTQLTA